MNSKLLKTMGGERVCNICGYVEREVYRLFCPFCMQRDRLSALICLETSHEAVPYPVDSTPGNPVQSVSV